MSMTPQYEQLRRSVEDVRVESADRRSNFIPENALDGVLTRDVVVEVVGTFTTFDRLDEVLDFVLKDAKKVFSILILIYHPASISRFIQHDQLQPQSADSRLPIDIEQLNSILEDSYVAKMFYERQWEFCAPKFTTRTIPRFFDPKTVLPYLKDEFLAGGRFGSVHRLVIHPAHCPDEFGPTAEFVRKELELDDETYKNEVQVLSSLQRLKHPNILRLVASYSHGSKHNLLSPYVRKGTLRALLDNDQETTFELHDMCGLMAGLASAVWALHEFVLEGISHPRKGHHQDLRPDNVLYDGQKFILADFGLSSIKSLSQSTKTAFKGRIGYCQAPECAEIDRPYEEHETTRATDVYSLGCILADLAVYQVMGRSGVEDFRNQRRFTKPPFDYHLFHMGNKPNEAVTQFLQQLITKDSSPSLSALIKLVHEMLSISPQKRPLAGEVTARLYVNTVQAFKEQFDVYFARLEHSADALIEEARFHSWTRAVDTKFFLHFAGATTTAEFFTSIVEKLRHFKVELVAISDHATAVDHRTLLEIRQLNTELLNMLPQDRRSMAQSHLASILLANIGPEKDDEVFRALRSTFGDAKITEMADTKQMVAQTENESRPGPNSLHQLDQYLIKAEIHILRTIGPYRIAKTHEYRRSNSRHLLMESIQYPDQHRRQKLLKRVHALCELLAKPHVQTSLPIPPFYGIRDLSASFTIDLLFNVTDLLAGASASLQPKSLFEILNNRDAKLFPALESRFKLALSLAEAIGAFHDLDWFHKDLTPFSVLFFGSRTTLGIDKPYIVGFQHSRNASDDFTEGPLQDRKHHRYHDPRYISPENRQFRKFKPQYDYYSLGILLLEIGQWDSVHNVMSDHAREDNKTFSENLIRNKLPLLAFSTSTKYAAVVKQCLTDWGVKDLSPETGGVLKAQNKLLFKQRVIDPLKSICAAFENGAQLSTPEVSHKRKSDPDSPTDTPHSWKKLKGSKS